MAKSTRKKPAISEPAQVITAEKEVVVKGKTTFGFGAMKKPTPKWATLAFKGYFYAASLTMIIVTVSSHVPTGVAMDVIEYLGFAGIGVHMLSEMFGVDVKKIESDANAFRAK